MDQELLNILLVEDDYSHAEIIMRCLRRCNEEHTIHHVADGEEALNFITSNTKKENYQNCTNINLILLDLRIPKIDGLQVLKTLKSLRYYREIPVIVLTSSDAESDKKNAYQNYANSYLVKPIGFIEFQNLISRIDEYWSKCNHLIHLN